MASASTLFKSTKVFVLAILTHQKLSMDLSCCGTWVGDYKLARSLESFLCATFLLPKISSRSHQNAYAATAF